MSFLSDTHCKNYKHYNLSALQNNTHGIVITLLLSEQRFKNFTFLNMASTNPQSRVLNKISIITENEKQFKLLF